MGFFEADDGVVNRAGATEWDDPYEPHLDPEHYTFDLPDGIAAALRREVDAAYRDGHERAGLLSYEDGELTGITTFDTLREHGLVTSADQKEIELDEGLLDTVAERNQDGVSVIGYHTHPRGHPESDYRDKQHILDQDAPEIILYRDGAGYHARLVGLVDRAELEQGQDKVSAEAVAAYTQGLAYRELTL